jgi:eukaryotic-like serine/threonine-protein kinase
LDLLRGGYTRFTFGATFDLFPVWSPDGTQIAFRSDRKGHALYAKPSNGGGSEQLLLETLDAPQDWSKDGFLLYFKVDAKTGRDLWALPITGTDRKPRAVANTSYDEVAGQYSPDGRWVTYETNESGQFEVVVQSFPEPNGKWMVSTNGGTSQDGAPTDRKGQPLSSGNRLSSQGAYSQQDVSSAICETVYPWTRPV